LALDLRRVYFAPDLMRPDRLPLGPGKTFKKVRPS